MNTYEIIMTGEGATDYGFQADGTAATWTPGAAACLALKCAEEFGISVKLSFAGRHDVEKIRLQRRSTQGLAGKAISSRRFYIYMCEHHFHYGIYYCDADKSTGRRNTEHDAKKQFNEVYDAVKQGLTPEGATAKAVPMVPLRMIEAWLLSDPAAYKSVFGKTPALPPKPELLWGKEEDPMSNYPKNCFKRICKDLSSQKQAFDRYLYIELALNTSISELRRRCPVSFDCFYDDFYHLLFET